MVDDFEEGSTREVELHDGSMVILKKLEEDYDPTDRWQAMRMMEEALQNNWLITGLIYLDVTPPNLFIGAIFPISRSTASPISVSDRLKIPLITSMICLLPEPQGVLTWYFPKYCGQQSCWR